MVAQFLARKPVNSASSTDSLLYHFQNYWSFDPECKQGKHKTAHRDFGETDPSIVNFLFPNKLESLNNGLLGGNWP